MSEESAPASTTQVTSDTAPTAESSQSTVVNLSDHRLSADELNVLSFGLSFCPTTRIDPIQLCGDAETFIRRMRLKKFFFDKDTMDSNPIDSNRRPGRISDVTWTPKEGRNVKLDAYIDAFRQRVNSECIPRDLHQRYNLSTKQRRALHSLRMNQSIVIKPADTGGAVVVMNRTITVRKRDANYRTV